MTTKKMKQNLSPQVMKAIGVMQEIYAALGDKQAYATTIVRGNKTRLIKQLCSSQGRCYDTIRQIKQLITQKRIRKSTNNC